MTYWKTQDFKDLQAAWYSKLAEDGFVDAESVIDEELVLKQTKWHALRGDHFTCIFAKGEYYEVMQAKVKEEKIPAKVHRIILVLTAAGAKAGQIVDTLVFLGKRRNRNSVRYIIRKYEMQWGIKTYTKKQLNAYQRRAPKAG